MRRTLWKKTPQTKMVASVWAMKGNRGSGNSHTLRGLRGQSSLTVSDLAKHQNQPETY